eukprot:TRINITY_DN5499_c0_g3_i1.p1 TRINITY_DN5499_c0_g3~~TRINITY_DN5499_c0_g3_i1.p1  ORF type:complete len:306 (-),score=36.98 TRINITY_DN5499_c0_g3_i1:236-1081(-)
MAILSRCLILPPLLVRPSSSSRFQSIQSRLLIEASDDSNNLQDGPGETPLVPSSFRSLKHFFSFKLKAGLILAVLTLVLGSSGLLGPWPLRGKESESSQLQPALPVNLEAIAAASAGSKSHKSISESLAESRSETSSESEESEDVRVVNRMYAYWEAGKLNGPGCLDAAKALALENSLYDFSSDSMAHVQGARIYHGLQGFCACMRFLQTFKQPDYKIVETLHNGKGSVMIKESVTPTVIATGKTLGHAMENVVEYHVQDGKLAYMKVFWGEPSSFGKLFV